VAACGTSFLKNMTMTIVLPVLLSSAEARSADDPLFSSGLVAASFSVGMVLSTSLMCCFSEELLDSRVPFVLCASLLLVGNVFYLAAELAVWPTIALVIIRVGMALGFGAQFAGKRRAGMTASKTRREYLFMLVEAANSVGQAAGPILMGLAATAGTMSWEVSYPGDAGTGQDKQGKQLAAAQPHRPMAWSTRLASTVLLASGDETKKGLETFLIVLAPVVTIALAGAFLAIMLIMPIDVPFFRAADQAPAAAASVAPGKADQSKAKEATPLIAPAAAEAPPPLWVSYAVQCSCLFYGVSRNFLFFGFESAAVVVYNRELLMPVSTASLVVGCCALTPLLALLLYSRYRKALEGKSQQLLLAAELLGIFASLLFIASSLFQFEATDLTMAANPDAESQKRLDKVRGPFLLLLAVGSVCFYGSIYLGAAMGNSHPLAYAVEGHPLLSRSAMVAEQQILQSTLGKGLGMVVCRVVLRDPVRLENLGLLFLGVMLTQVIVLQFGWDPQKTQRRFCGSRAAPVASI